MNFNTYESFMPKLDIYVEIKNELYTGYTIFKMLLMSLLLHKSHRRLKVFSIIWQNEFKS